jgi:hypothetical protein
MKFSIQRSISIAIVTVTVLLTGCATKFERQAFNSEAAAGVKKITVSQWDEQKEIPTFLISHPMQGFGLIGAALVVSDRAGKTKTMTEALDMEITKISTGFYSKVLPALKEIGYEVSPIAVKRGEKIETIRESVLKDQGQDASLMLGIDAVYVAAGATSDYYPAVSMTAELTDNKTKAVLYRDVYEYGYNNGNKEIQHIAAAPVCKFSNMEALTKDINLTRKCLMDSIDLLVAQLKTDLKK